MNPQNAAVLVIFMLCWTSIALKLIGAKYSKRVFSEFQNELTETLEEVRTELRKRKQP